MGDESTRDDELVTRSAGLYLRAVRAKERTADFVCSTDAVDSYGDVVEQTWDLSRYEKNPVVLFAHKSRDLPIGVAENTRVEDGALVCTIRFLEADANPLAEQVWQCVQAKAIRAVSVGFNPRDVRFERRNGEDVCVLGNNELFEISAVPVPANPEALMRQRADAKERARDKTKTAERGREKTMTEEQIKAALAEKDAIVASTNKALEDEKAKYAALAEELKKTAEARDAATKRADELEAKAVEAEVDALVGKKITPAERDAMLRVRKLDKSAFDAVIAARADMKILDKAIGEPPAPIPPSTTDATDAGDDFASEVERLAKDDLVTG